MDKVKTYFYHTDGMFESEQIKFPEEELYVSFKDYLELKKENIKLKDKELEKFLRRYNVERYSLSLQEGLWAHQFDKVKYFTKFSTLSSEEFQEAAWLISEERTYQSHKKTLHILNYCMKEGVSDSMWAATVCGILLDCDFRDSKMLAEEYLCKFQGKQS